MTRDQHHARPSIARKAPQGYSVLCQVQYHPRGPVEHCGTGFSEEERSVIGEREVEGEDATGAKSIFLMSCRVVMGRLMFHTRLPALTPDATGRNALFFAAVGAYSLRASALRPPLTLSFVPHGRARPDTSVNSGLPTDLTRFGDFSRFTLQSESHVNRNP